MTEFTVYAPDDAKPSLKAAKASLGFIPNLATKAETEAASKERG